jgi:VanZ family protein
VLWLAFVLAWTAALLVPSPDRIARALLARVLPGAEGNHDLDVSLWWFSKSLHVIVYALLAILSGWLRVPWRSRWLLLVFISAHGFCTEFLQHFVVSRHGSLRDVGLDHLGAAIGVGLSWKWWLERP